MAAVLPEEEQAPQMGEEELDEVPGETGSPIAFTS